MAGFQLIKDSLHGAAHFRFIGRSRADCSASANTRTDHRLNARPPVRQLQCPNRSPFERATDEIFGPDRLPLAGFNAAHRVGHGLERRPQRNIDLSAQADRYWPRLVEAEVAEANQKLRDQMVEREDTELRLQELQSELFHAARLSAMGQMAGALAHELSQPLGTATNFANAARRLLASGQHDRLGMVLSNVDAVVAQVLRAAQIMQRLKDFVGQAYP